MDKLKEVLQKLGASTEVVDSFMANGYSNEEDLKTITGFELKNVIPQLLLRKKFSRALIPWLILQQAEIDEEIALTAGLHPSQTTVTLGSETADSSKSVNSIDCSSLYSSSTKSLGSEKSTSDESCSLLKPVETISETTEDNIDLSIFDTDTDFDSQLQRERDLAKAKSFDVTHDIPILEKPDAIIIDRQKNPIWVLLNKGTLESKRIAQLPESTCLTTAEIKEVAQIVAQYLFAEASPPKHQVTPSTCSFWATEYFHALFPDTGVHRFYFIKREAYCNKSGQKLIKTRPTGALYTQLCIKRKKLLLENDAAKIRSTNNNNSESKPDVPQKITRGSYRTVSENDNDVVYSPPEAANETLNLKLGMLRTEAPSHASADVLESWKDTHAYRMSELKETQGSVWDYIKLYKGLANPAVGPILIKKDFELLFGASNTNSKLQDFLLSKKTNIITVAKEALRKITADSHKDLITSFLQLTEADDVKLQSTGLLLLIPMIFPGVYQVNKNWKPSKTNVLRAFICKVDTEADVDERIDELQKHLTETQKRIKWKVILHMQPFVLAVGPSWNDIIQAHIILHKVVYTLPTVPEAVELCFQLFHSLHAEYPLECHNVWEFIQKAVYGIDTEFDWNHRATSELAEQLGISLKQHSQAKSSTKHSKDNNNK